MTNSLSGDESKRGIKRRPGGIVINENSFASRIKSACVYLAPCIFDAGFSEDDAVRYCPLDDSIPVTKTDGASGSTDDTTHSNPKMYIPNPYDIIADLEKEESWSDWDGRFSSHDPVFLEDVDKKRGRRNDTKES